MTGKILFTNIEPFCQNKKGSVVPFQKNDLQWGGMDPLSFSSLSQTGIQAKVYQSWGFYYIFKQPNPVV